MCCRIELPSPKVASWIEGEGESYRMQSKNRRKIPKMGNGKRSQAGNLK
jgi:hypothetical protein